MSRKKVNFAFIENDGKRRDTYRKRQKGFVKKAGDLSKLCEVETASVMFSPYQKEPIVFPNNDKTINIFTRFKRLPPLFQSKNMMTIDMFTKKRIAKMEKKLEKLRKENNIKEITILMKDVMKGKDVTIDMNPADINDMMLMMRQHLKKIHEMMKNKADGDGSTSSASCPILGQVVLRETNLEGPMDPLLSPTDGPIPMVSMMAPLTISGGIDFEGPRAPLFFPDMDVDPVWDLPMVDLPIIPSFSHTEVPQQLHHLEDPLMTPPQMVSHVDPLLVPHYSSFSSEIFSPMVPQLYSSTSQQIELTRDPFFPRIPPTTIDLVVSSLGITSPMCTPVFSLARLEMDPSMSIPIMGPSIPVNDN
ncbi:hypothetical protein P3S68_022645 [Capsicum galapagoense]